MSYLNHSQELPKIHVLTFLEASRRSCQYFLSLLAEVSQTPNENPHILLDMRQSGLLPLVYLSKEFQSLSQQIPQRPVAQLAMVVDKPQSLRTCQLVLDAALRHESVEYFTEIEQARCWLLQH